jgi:hypothetical protein
VKIGRAPRLILVFCLLVAALNLSVGTSQAAAQWSRFESISRDLQRLQAVGLIAAGASSHDPVTFDEAAARKAGYAETTLQLAQELVALTNDVIANGNAAVIDAKAPASTADQDYAALISYFSEAKQYSSSTHPRVQFLAAYNEAICGAFWNPLPSHAAAWVTFNNIANPDATLRSWGYHPTAGYAHGEGVNDWTRPQTYASWACYWGSFRDQAIITGAHSLREQKYWGWTPNGEPNPEISNYLWPYPTWPAYVYWWHQTH